MSHSPKTRPARQEVRGGAWQDGLRHKVLRTGPCGETSCCLSGLCQLDHPDVGQHFFKYIAGHLRKTGVLGHLLEPADVVPNERYLILIRKLIHLGGDGLAQFTVEVFEHCAASPGLLLNFNKGVGLDPSVVLTERFLGLLDEGPLSVACFRRSATPG